MHCVELSTKFLEMFLMFEECPDILSQVGKFIQMYSV